MYSRLFEEIESIKTTAILGGLEIEDRLQMEPYFECFPDSTVLWNLICYNKFTISVSVDFFTHEVYLIEIWNGKTPLDVSKWVHEKYANQYNKEAFDAQFNSRNVNMVRLSSEIINEIRKMVDDIMSDDILKGGQYDDENFETVALDLTNEEIAQIALAAHAKDMTINEFINHAVLEGIKRENPEIYEDVMNAKNGESK